MKRLSAYLVGFLAVLFIMSFVSADIICSDPSQLLFSLNKERNAHAAAGGVYDFDICFDRYFGGTFDGTSDLASRIVWLSSSINAHGSGPAADPHGPEEIIYGDLTCELRTDLCEGYTPGGRRSSFIVSMNKDHNSHFALGSAYGNSLCCVSASVAAICDYDLTCDETVGETTENCPHDCNEPLTVIASYDYQPENGITQNGWTAVSPGGGGGSIWASGTVTGVEGPEIVNNPLSNALRDYHKVTGSELISELSSNSDVRYRVNVYYGSETEASGPFTIIAEKGTAQERRIGSAGITTAAGEFSQAVGDVEVHDGSLNIDFEHAAGNSIALSGMVLSGFCGDGNSVSPEQCDNGDNEATGKRNSGEEVNSECIIDTSQGGLMCEWNNVCGDGYRNSTEQCDDGNLVDDDGCSSTCTNVAPAANCPETEFNYEDAAGNTFEIDFCSEINNYVGEIPNVPNPEQYLCETCSGANGVPTNPSFGSSCVYDPADSSCKGTSGGTGAEACVFEIIGEYSCTDGGSTATANVRKTGVGCNCPGGEDQCETTEEVPCPRVIRLPFFGVVGFVLSIILISLIYYYLEQKK